MAIKTDGSLWAWGYSIDFQLGDRTVKNSLIPTQIIASGVTAIAAGYEHTIFLKTDGSLWAWGSNKFGELGDGTTTDCLVPKQIMADGVKAISAGSSYTIVLNRDGSCVSITLS